MGLSYLSFVLDDLLPSKTPIVLEALEILLRSPIHRSRNALSRAIQREHSDNVLERLIQAECGPCLGAREPSSWPLSRQYPEPVQSVIMQNQRALQLLFQYEYDLDAPCHLNGITALYLAIDWGWRDGVEVYMAVRTWTEFDGIDTYKSKFRRGTWYSRIASLDIHE